MVGGGDGEVPLALLSGTGVFWVVEMVVGYMMIMFHTHVKVG